MPTTNAFSWIARAALVMGFAGSLMGCGGIKTGDYELYRVSLARPVKSASCYNVIENVADPNETKDSDTHVDIQMWSITAAPADAYDLEGYTDPVGTAKGLSGTKADSGFDFQAKKVDITNTPDSPSAPKRETVTETWDVPITTDGAGVSGTIVYVHKY